MEARNNFGRCVIYNNSHDRWNKKASPKTKQTGFLSSKKISLQVINYT